MNIIEKLRRALMDEFACELRHGHYEDFFDRLWEALDTSEKEKQEVHALTYGGTDGSGPFAHVYVGVSHKAACKAFCEKFLVHQLVSMAEEEELELAPEDSPAPKLAQTWQAIKRGRFAEAVDKFGEYIYPEEQITVYVTEVQS